MPNLVCAATSNCDEPFHFEGATCIETFLEWLRELAQDFKLNVLAHNTQGFDYYIILDVLYEQYVMPDQIVNGAKILSLSINGGDMCSKTHCVQRLASKCSCPFSPKHLDSRNKRKGSSPTFSTRPAVKTTWDLCPTRHTMILMGCPLHECKNSNDGTRNTIPTTSSISKPSSWPIANPMCCCSKGPAKSFFKNSKRSAVSIPWNAVLPSHPPAISSSTSNRCQKVSWPPNLSAVGMDKANRIPTQPWNG